MPHCQGLIRVGNYSFHYQLQAWSQVAEAIITLSVSWAHGAHPQHHHLWSWVGIFLFPFQNIWVQVRWNTELLNHIMSPCLKNSDATYIEWKVIMFFNENRSEEHPGELWYLFQETENSVLCNLNPPLSQWQSRVTYVAHDNKETISFGWISIHLSATMLK